MKHFRSYTELDAALAAGEFLFTPAFGPASFDCTNCGERHTFNDRSGGVSTGYARGHDGNMFCYGCCGLMDAFAMGWTGKATLYLSGHDVAGMKGNGDYHVGNWPGTIRIKAGVSKGRHNIARVRYDARFKGPDGANWHGVTYGDMTQICHCKRLKA